MDLTGIISISGKPGLYKVVARSKNNIIVESLIDNKRIPAYSTDRISALDDISIYTYEEDTPLREVYATIAEKEDCKAILSHKESNQKLSDYLLEVLPDYDEDKVYPSDIKKLVQWYNILQKAGYITLDKEEEEVEVEEVEEVVEKKEKKAPAKKAAKAPAKKTEKEPAAKKKAAPAKKSAEEEE